MYSSLNLHLQSSWLANLPPLCQCPVLPPLTQLRPFSSEETEEVSTQKQSHRCRMRWCHLGGGGRVQC